MSKNSTSTRRMFLRAGALMAAPLAAAAVSAVPLADNESADTGLVTRLKRLEDEAAIRELHQSWVRQINSGADQELLEGTVRRIMVDHAGAAEKIEVATDRRSAVGIFDCAVELQAPLAADCTLAQMAHAQGHGIVCRTERRMLTVDYVKTNDTWKIDQVSLRTP